MFEVIVYLFEHYLHNEVDLDTGSETLSDALEKAGFTENEILNAFLWLEGWAKHRENTNHLEEHLSMNIRLYAPEEQQKLTQEAIGFLMFLEQGGIVTPKMRELIIDRALAVEMPHITLEEIKWISLIILFCQSDEDFELSWLENLIFAETGHESLH
jgi:Smg protein